MVDTLEMLPIIINNRDLERVSRSLFSYLNLQLGNNSATVTRHTQGSAIETWLLQLLCGSHDF